MDAEVTDLVEFVSLNDNPDKWAEKAIGFKQVDKSHFADLIKNFRFNILVEAKPLEDTLKRA